MPGRIVAYGAATAPSGWLLCDGASYLRADHAGLFDVIGTLFGAADATHFNVPDLRDRFALGKAAAGTGATLAETGGSLAHTHSGPTHTHAVTQPSAHSAHVVTQASAHTNLSHAGFAVADHAAVSHSGASIAAHSVTQTSNHGKHASEGSHQHSSHVLGTMQRGSGSTALLAESGGHTAGGDHDHDAHSGHNESVNAHSISSQGADHASVSHAITQSSAHTSISHASSSVDAHAAHSGMSAADASATTDADDPPYLVLSYIIATSDAQTPVGVIVENASAVVPTDHLLCNGQAVSRATYSALFAIIGTTFGVGNGTTTFNVPDMRGRHVIGKSSGSSLAATGGSAAHAHTSGAHVHATTQAGNHADHVIGQATSHSLTHSGLAVADHAAAAHSGFAVSAHSVTQSSGHGTHTNDGGHTHDSHSTSASHVSGSFFFGGPSTHSTDGDHDHDAHSAHSGAALSAHSETQAATHAAASHTIVQPSAHTISHSGAALNAHSVHSGASIDSGGAAATSSDDVPYLGLHFVIRTAVSARPIGTLFAFGSDVEPDGTLICDGSAISRTTYSALFAALGTVFGAGNGSTTFNLPDLRGRIPRGAGGPSLGAAGGALDHTHTGPAHLHTTVQPSAHSAHVATQPSDHASQTHSGADVSNTHSLAHTGMSVASHSVTQASSHSSHAAASSHNHNSHTAAGDEGAGAFVSVMTSPTAHSNQGSHDHSGSAHTHSGFGVSAHSETQANAHTRAHSGVTQPSSHTLSVHSGFAVDAHSAHSGFALALDGASGTSSANPPFLVVNYVVQALPDIEVHSATFEITATFGLVISTISTTETAVPNTPPSSPIIYILEPPA